MRGRHFCFKKATLSLQEKNAVFQVEKEKEKRKKKRKINMRHCATYR
jgi:hypothetical protein